MEDITAWNIDNFLIPPLLSLWSQTLVSSSSASEFKLEIVSLLVVVTV